MELKIVDRLSHYFSHNSNNVHPFGLDYSGKKFTEDFDSRGDIFQQDITDGMRLLINNVIDNHSDYVVYETPNPKILVLSKKIIDPDYLVELFTVIFMVDLYKNLYDLKGCKKQFDKLFSLTYYLNGENEWNFINGLVDTQNNTFIGRINSNLSGTTDGCLAYNPIRLMLQVENLSLQTVHVCDIQEISDKARTLAYNKLKEKFFLKVKAMSLHLVAF